ncbi:MAG: hypothetical protein FWC80_00355 [Firmicutes bacterium]|nr:hypothetical protein [Bacillota bacterium]
MPRYREKFKREMTFFINPRTGDVTYNKKCAVCIHDCKQSYKTKIITCQFYEKATEKLLKANKHLYKNKKVDC